MPVISSTIASAAVVVSAAIQTVPVQSVEPIIRNEVVTVHTQQCQQVISENNSIVGGVIGGIIGSQIGRSEDTRRVMTGVGAIIGSQAANSPTYNTRCAPTYHQQAVPTVVGYNVTYVVDGIRQSTVMSYNPGSHVTIQRNYTAR
jgi:uncharacterized protein YcfJ